MGRYKLKLAVNFAKIGAYPLLLLGILEYICYPLLKLIQVIKPRERNVRDIKSLWDGQNFLLDTAKFQRNQKVSQDIFLNKISLYIYYKRQAMYDHELISHDQHDKYQVFRSR